MTVVFRRRAAALAFVPAAPRYTVRLRLTVLYGCCFLASGVALLAITYALVDSRLSQLQVSTGTGPVPGGGERVHATSSVAGGLRAQRAADVHQLLVQSGFALAIMAVASVALGWLVAGRILRPLRAITAATRRISERNLHERLALSGPDDELRDLAATIDGLLGRLDAAFDSQKRFVANASHELRTPLMLTQTLLQVAMADPAITLDALKATCRDVLVACKDQDRLIQALLTLARGQAGIEHRSPFDLAGVAAQVLKARETETEVMGLQIETALHSARVCGDPHLVEILVANLIDNATRHNIPGGRIHVATGTPNACPTLTVLNTGTQLPAEQVQRLLQPFQRLDGERGEGLGLGLSIVAAIAGVHDATLSVQPLPTGGLCVEVRWV